MRSRSPTCKREHLLRPDPAEDPRRQDAPIDSRPSDAISLALRTKSPIYVAKRVLEDSSELQQAADEPGSKEQNLADVSRDKWAEILEKMSPDDFKYKM